MSTPMSAVVKTACPPHLLSPCEMVMLPLEHFLQNQNQDKEKPNKTKIISWVSMVSPARFLALDSFCFQEAPGLAVSFSELTLFLHAPLVAHAVEQVQLLVLVALGQPV